MPAVPASKKSINQNRFTWTVPGTRRKIDLPAVGTLTARQLRDLTAKKTASIDDLVGIADSEAVREALLDLSMDNLGACFKAWTEAGNLGKS